MSLAQALKDQGVELRSPVPGQIPVCDLLGPTIASYKTLPASPHGKKLTPPPLQLTWCQTGALQFSEGSCYQGVTAEASPALMHICIPSLGTSIQRPLSWGPCGGIFFFFSYLPQYFSNASTFPSSSFYSLLLP